MIRTSHSGRLSRAAAILVLAACAASCSIFDQSAPALTGPSERGTSFRLVADTDQLPRDGTSQTVVTVLAYGNNSEPLAGRDVAVGITGAPATLSATSLKTNEEGKAFVAVTAPPPASTGNYVDVSILPVGSNLNNATTRSVRITILGPGNAFAPNAQFTYSPASPTYADLITFDASTSTDEDTSGDGVADACLSACTYAWTFGDGATASGLTATHQYASPGTYTVSLTVTDGAGATDTVSQQVFVNAVAAPTVTIALTPAAPVTGQATTFTATATAATGHFVTSYSWDWGDGSENQTSNASIVKTFDTPGTYGVTVTVTDDLGQTGVTTKQVTVTSGITVSFTVSPTGPAVGQTVNFNATATTIDNGATITSYAWDFGDGNTTTTTTATASKAGGYGTAGTYVVRLTVTDSIGRTGTATVEVTVK